MTDAGTAPASSADSECREPARIAGLATGRWQRTVEVLLVTTWVVLGVIALYGAWVYDR